MLIGVIADDFTGASDIAVTLVKGLEGEGGLATTQYLGVPSLAAHPEVDVGVVALKTRSVPAREAVRQSLAACQWLMAQGCQQIVFKYCSTFDSTAEGNIGPVLTALAEFLQESSVIVCPAFPTLGRTVYQGHLFVGDKLLNESGMEHHPLTPMRDADIRRVLAQQTTLPVSHIAWQSVQQGVSDLAAMITERGKEGSTLIVADAVSNQDLVVLGKAAAGRKLVSGGSGIAMALPHNFKQQGKGSLARRSPPALGGAVAILVGSCSGATRGQIEQHRQSYAVMAIDIDLVMANRVTANTLVDFIMAHQSAYPLVYSSGDSQAIRQAQARYGQDNVSAKLDQLFGDTAKILVYERGVSRLVVGGGETSGAVVSALNLASLQVGDEIDPGVPALFSEAEHPLGLALKSGNFGRPTFFKHAIDYLASSQG